MNQYEIADYPDFISIGHITYDVIKNGFTIGGSSVYSSLTARNFGYKSAILTTIGENFQFWDSLKDVDVVFSVSSCNTTFKNLYVNGFRLQYLVHRAEKIKPSVIPKNWLQSEIIYLCPVIDEIDAEIIDLFPEALIGIGAQGWMRSWDEKGFVKGKSWEKAENFLSRAKILIFSIEDIRGFEEEINKYRELIDIMIVTMGARGATLYLGKERYHIPAYDTVEVDPTGAGDVFSAAFLLYYKKTADPFEAARLATCAASFVVEKEGIMGIPQEELFWHRKEAYDKKYKIERLK